MAFTNYYLPPMASVAGAAYGIGAGQQQQGLNTQQIQQNQFGAQIGLEQQTLDERARQFDTQFAEGVRQFDTSTDINQQQFGAQQQLAQQEVQQRGFLNLAGMWNQNQQQSERIAANERMAEFQRQADLERMGYQAGLEASSRVYGMDQQLKMQQQAQQAEYDQRLQHLNGLFGQGQMSATDYAAFKSQLDQQQMGFQGNDPTVLMNPEMKEQYRQDMAQMQARETDRLTLAQTTKSQAYWNEQGLTYDPQTGKYQVIPSVMAKIEQDTALKKYEFEAKAAAEKEAKEQLRKFNETVDKKMQETIPDVKNGGTKLRYPTYEEAYNAAVKIYGNVTGATPPPPQPGAEKLTEAEFARQALAPFNAIRNTVLGRPQPQPVAQPASPAMSLDEYRARRNTANQHY